MNVLAEARANITPQLVENAQTGNLMAFGRIYELYYPALLGYSINVLHNLPIAEDAVQNAMLKAMIGIGKVKGPLKVEPWLFKITRNEIANHFRVQMLEAAYERKINTRLETDPLSIIADKAEVVDALRPLPPRQQLIILLNTGHNFRHSEIAPMLGLAVQTVRHESARGWKTILSAA